MIAIAGWQVSRAAEAKAVTSQTPSPQSKTWRSFTDPSQRHGFSTAPATRIAAEHLKRLIHEGDLDRVSAFLEQVKQQGSVV
jgi:hypothetical protein